jgi:hypothetical protein
LRDLLPVVVILGGFLTACSASRESRDSDVVAAALEHFTGRDDIMPYNKRGITLVEPQTREFVSGFGDQDPKCQAPRELYEELATRNAMPLSAAPLVSASGKWRLIRPEETTGDELGYMTDRTMEGEPIRTIVRLSVPAYSGDGQAALLIFHFKWSIHSALARYVLQFSEDGWRVQCSDLRFYV